MRLHGAIREWAASGDMSHGSSSSGPRPTPWSSRRRVSPAEPRAAAAAAGGDVFDVALAGMTATVEEILERWTAGQLAVTSRTTPAGARRGSPDRPPLLLLARGGRAARGAPPRRQAVLVAGIGNVFFGDDGFGVEVAGRLASASSRRGGGGGLRDPRDGPGVRASGATTRDPRRRRAAWRRARAPST